MSSANFNEEIIELTEVVEEGAGVKKRPVAPPPPPPKKETLQNEDVFQSIPDSPLKKFILAEQQEDPTPQLKREFPKSPSPPPEPFKPASLPAEEDIRRLEQSLAEQVEKWMSRQGTPMLERMVREMFPRIAQEVLRKEIEKLKAEAEEKS
jgi:hypothetical protein